MPYAGPGAAVLGPLVSKDKIPATGVTAAGQAEYNRLCREFDENAGGAIGSSVTGPLVLPKAEEDPDAFPIHPLPVEDVAASFVSMHVMVAKKLIATASVAECQQFLAEEQARANGPRPTLIAALEERLA